MIVNGDDTAFPSENLHDGLSKREYAFIHICAAIVQGKVAHGSGTNRWDTINEAKNVVEAMFHHGDTHG